MVRTRLLIVEINVNVTCLQGTPGVGLIALGDRKLVLFEVAFFVL